MVWVVRINSSSCWMQVSQQDQEDIHSKLALHPPWAARPKPNQKPIRNPRFKMPTKSFTQTKNIFSLRTSNWGRTLLFIENHFEPNKPHSNPFFYNSTTSIYTFIFSVIRLCTRFRPKDILFFLYNVHLWRVWAHRTFFIIDGYSFLGANLRLNRCVPPRGRYYGSFGIF